MSLESTSDWLPRHKPMVGAADAPVLWETDPGPSQELCVFDLTDYRINQLVKLSTLLVGNRSQQILNLREAFPHESYDGDVGDTVIQE